MRTLLVTEMSSIITSKGLSLANPSPPPRPLHPRAALPLRSRCTAEVVLNFFLLFPPVGKVEGPAGKEGAGSKGGARGRREEVCVPYSITRSTLLSFCRFGLAFVLILGQLYCSDCSERLLPPVPDRKQAELEEQQRLQQQQEEARLQAEDDERKVRAKRVVCK
jgi:hypothetical protein